MGKKLFVSKNSRKLVSKDLADFYLAESNLHLSSILDVGHKITDRAYLLLAGILVILTGVSWTMYNKIDKPFIMAATLVGLLACIAVLVILFWKVINVHTIWLSGKKPSEFNINGFMKYYKNQKIKDDNLYVNVVMDHLCALEMKMADNEKSNNQRIKWYNVCFGICLAAIISIILLIFIDNLLLRLPFN